MKEIICKVFGHSWTYYQLQNDVRVCDCCHRMQEWKHVFSPGKIWSWSIQYKDYGALLHVEGYGKP